MFKKLVIKADELEGLLAQAACHAPATLNQLVTTAILAKGEEKPNSTFVGQVILNASTKADENACQLSFFVYHMADPPTTPIHSHWDHHTLGVSHPISDNPPNILSTNLGPPASTVVDPGIGERTAQTPIHARVSQVQFMERHAADKVLIDSDSNSSITITQMATLRIPVKGGLVVIGNVAFSNKVLGTIFSVGILCRAGVFPFFSGLMLSLVVRDHLVTTTFHNNCWWMNVTVGEETNESAAETSSLPLIAMNPLSFPATSKLSCREWHASNKVVRSFLKQNVPSFELKSWKPFYCEVCAKSKSTHWLAKAHVDVPMDQPLDLLVSNIMGPFSQDPQGFQYLLTICDHVSTYSIVYPLKLRSDAPAAILDAIAHLSVQLGISPKALWTVWDEIRQYLEGEIIGKSVLNFRIVQ
ncbi:hypothetical protein O181_020487 [Austropuccinia psidii MF-1]|uniref:Integrase catalytic domain-containing protein n=1 Tax=Austropuccinia psidii MF-1 TaxID=1389203 RepID=A0A9Q3CBR6_9BASI|nr:hypothetical protein [Austropuccinia psidii MF-1]